MKRSRAVPFFSRDALQPANEIFQSEGIRLPDDFSLILLELERQRWNFVRPLERPRNPGA